MSITIKDVAREANVSVATVSRALNGHENVAPDVRQRVLEVADRLQYSPHHAARSLSSRRTQTIGVVLPDLYGEFFSELMRGIDAVAREAGRHLLVSSYHGNPDEQGAALRAMRGRVDGLLLMSPFVADADPLALEDALIALGDDLFEADQYASAAASYNEALQHAEQHAGLESERVLAPLLGLGNALAASGHHEDAVLRLQRALAMQRSQYRRFNIRDIEPGSTVVGNPARDLKR